MAEQTAEATIKEIKKFIKHIKTNIHEDALRRCLNETWFSDTLAWLMDPKGNHRLGVEFSKAFICTVAKKRSAGKSKYSHKSSRLRWGKGGQGQIATQFKFENSASLREFFLSRTVKMNNNKEGGTGQLYFDVAFMDLDSKDGIFLVIENKLFAINTKTQLLDYHKAVEDKFKRVGTREYVYLTLHGESPAQYDQGKDLMKEWVCLSWLSDIREILEQLIPQRDCHKKVEEFLHLLQYLQKITEGTKTASSELLKLFLKVASDCLFEELQRLATKRGKWEREKDNKIHHSSLPAKHLKIGLLPNRCVTVQGMKNSKAIFDKILIPFGVHPDQTFNLFDIAAREIYHAYFGENDEYIKYLNNKKKLTKTVTPERKRHLGILEFIHKNRYHLQVLLQNNPQVQKEAESLENENDANIEA